MARPWVLVTGAGSGIGQGIAEKLAKEGHPVLVTDISAEAADKVTALINESGGQAKSGVLDVGSVEAIEAYVKSLDVPVGVLVNNAGLQHVARLEEFPPERWEMMIQIMLNGAAMLTRALLPGMRELGYGRVVNIGSIHALVASPYKSAYVAAKHGLLGFSKVMALETADTDITVNTVCPSYVKTPLVEKQIANQAKENGITPEEVESEIMLKPMPKGVFISIEELADITLFLMSHSARNITGQTITVDGGWTVR
ncbi:3-hydroxybutyrate dehydrogenase [Pokkaliibacter sp. CJK22405]|uniref:3-hydroxybutyrate dehydrogenase n=1 Tax=Pokkaliibacter sp. CJK22405 TaxID=3384615 RepID=UPI003985034B